MNDYYEQMELELPKEKRYENLTLSNDFIFGKVMKDKELCSELLELLTGNKIENIVWVNDQKPIKITNDAKGVRYDIYVENDKDDVYDAEMQQINDKEELPKRARYYQGMIDLNLLESGAEYTTLKNSYVIFVCCFDPFDEGLCCYRFENLCKEKSNESLGDGRIILFFNAKGKKINVTEEVKAFLDYVDTENSTNEFTAKLEKAVKKARMNKEWRVEYMKTLLHDMDVKNEGIRIGKELGIAIGEERGIAIGEERGSRQRLIDLVKKKLEKGKDIATIAMEVEEDEEKVREIIESL